MLKWLKKTAWLFPISLLLCLAWLFPFVPSAFAIGNPSSITFGSGSDTNMYQAFQNVAESGDMLFVAETDIHYTSEPTDYEASEAFFFELLGTDGTTVLYSTPILAYENYVTSIYLTAAQATSLTWEDAYAVRLTGNPAIFGTPVEGTNQRTATLMPSDYITDSPAGTSVAGLRIFCLNVAKDLQDHDSPTYAYIVAVQGVSYLTTTGANIMLAGIPGLNTFCPTLFQTTMALIEPPEVPSTGTLQASLSYMNQLGPTIGNAVRNFGTWWGMGDTMAGIVILFAVMLLVCGYVYVRTQNPLLPDALAMALPFLGAYLGLVPLALAFTITLLIAVITLYYFFTRGVL